MHAPGDAAVAIVLAALNLYTAFSIARAWLPTAPVSVRACAAGVVSLWLWIAVFHALAWAGWFTVPIALALFATAAAVARLVWDRQGLAVAAARSDLRSAADAARRALGSPERWFYVVGALLLLFVTVRGLLTPPLAHDTLTYHQFLAGGWVQHAGVFSLTAPDAWSYYRYFPGNGEVFAAWFMLPFHADTLANLASLLPWLAALLAFYCLARFLELRRRWAALGALLLGFTPAVFAYLPCGYVEIPLLAALLGGTLFTARALKTRRGVDVVLAGMAYGCALGTKVTAAPVIAVGLGVLVLAGGWRPSHLRWLLAGIVLAAVVSLPWYLRAWIEQGSPLYPMAMRLPGGVELAGAAAFHRMMQPSVGAETLGRLHGEWQNLKLFLPHPYTLGPVALVAIALAPRAIASGWKRAGSLPTVALMLGAVAVLLNYFSPYAAALRTHWPATGARFLVYALAVSLLGVLAVLDDASARLRLGRLVLLGILALDFALALWRGYSGVPLAVVSGGFVLAIAALVVGRFVLFSPRLRHVRGRSIAALALVMWIVGPPALDAVRDRFRGRFLAEAYEFRPFPLAAAPAWAHADRQRDPRRIAFAAGWEEDGHNWLWAPLLGARLQHQVTYVPITSSGRVMDYADPEALAPQADFGAWLGRLLDQRIDLVVVPTPTPFETAWIAEQPAVFRPVEKAGGGVTFALDREEARALLDRRGD